MATEYTQASGMNSATATDNVTESAPVAGVAYTQAAGMNGETSTDNVAELADLAVTAAAAAAADLLLTDADTITTAADRSAVAADLAQTNIDQLAVAEDAAQVAIDKAAVAANLVLTAADTVATAADAAQVANDRAAVAANLVLTDADQVATATDRAAVAADLLLTDADTVATAADRSAVAADLVQTNIDQLAVAADAAQVAIDKAAVAADLVLTAADTVATAADRVVTTQDALDTAADVVLTNADVVTSAAAAAAAAASYDSFDDRYLGAKASEPALDNDGAALVTGVLYFSTTSDSMWVYDGATWLAAYASLSGALLAASNLSDLVSAPAARTNLGLGTAATTASTAYATAAQGAKADAALPKAGGAMTGAITTNSTFDGRDVSVDGTKLDGVEALADVTDTANVTSAGALMDSEVSANLKTLVLPATTTISTYGASLVDDTTAAAARTTLGLGTAATTASTAYATAVQGTKADAALPKAGGAMTGAITTTSTFDGRNVSVDGAKLDGIEAGANVTDTANVTAAGALMDSEVDADIKTLVLPASTTISAFGRTLIDDAAASNARTTLGLGTAATTASTAYATAEQGALADTSVQRTATTGQANLPSGTTAQRTVTPATGAFRFNSTETAFEGYNGTEWGAVGGGGGAVDGIFYENDQVVTANYTIVAAKNAMTAGPIDINSGITVTIETGARWVVV